MSWIGETLKKIVPVSDDLGMVVRPVFSGSDPGVLTVKPLGGSFSEIRPGVSTVTAVSYSADTNILRNANADRRGLLVFNNTNKIMYVKEGTEASIESWTLRIPPDSLYEFSWPVYTGVVTCFWATGGSGNAMVTERTT